MRACKASNDWKKLVDAQTVIDCPEYVFEIDEYGRGDDRVVFVHLTVHKWSLSVFKRMLRDVAAFREAVSCPYFAVGAVDDEKFAKFMQRLGFKFLTHVICRNGERRRLFINLKEHRSVVQQTNHTVLPERHDRPVGSTIPVPVTGVLWSV